MTGVSPISDSYSSYGCVLRMCNEIVLQLTNKMAVLRRNDIMLGKVRYPEYSSGILITLNDVYVRTQYVYCIQPQEIGIQLPYSHAWPSNDVQSRDRRGKRLLDMY